MKFSLITLSLFILTFYRRIEHVEQSRVVKKRLPEAGYKERSTIRSVNNRMNKDIRFHIPNKLQNRIPWTTAGDHRFIEQVFKSSESIHSKKLVSLKLKIVNVDHFPVLNRYRVVLERNFKPLTVSGQPSPRLLYPLSWPKTRLWKLYSRNPQLRGPTRSITQVFDKNRPLKTVSNTKVDNMKCRRR
ncbi:hypothetical protein HanRHA438_Chr06g0269761 [Helianthus annuus]|nr:hypothetical protein HanRHA438_Chr06g0269761 [Helianthus annuus]